MKLFFSVLMLVFGLQSQAADQAALQVTDLNTQRAAGDEHISEFFGHVQLNMSNYRAWSISNTGTTPLELLEMSLSGMMYHGSTDCPKVLQPQQACEIQIRFSPFTEGYHTGYLDVIVNEGGNLYFDFWGYGVR